MKKVLALIMALVFVFALAACGGETKNDAEINAKSEGVMTYAEYAAADLESEVVIEAYVQAKQGWWEKEGVGGVATVYTQDKDGAYFLYDMLCPEEDYAKLTPGTKIKVTGYKAEWSGEVEIIDASFEIVEGGATYVAEAIDLTDKLGTEELINYQNQYATFKGLTVKSLAYKDSEWDKDIYLTVTKDGTEYSFCVENYLCGPDTDVYKAVAALKEGDIIDVTGFAYWYEGINTHVTAVEVK
ncbi:MAG: hypothetical protein E7623_05675 [Ruminococcaceae bacterium]|nr:hypothetical protein [Oscillospiraceae bacterium]